MLGAATLLVAASAVLNARAVPAAPVRLEFQEESCGSQCCNRTDERTDAALGLGVRARLSCGVGDHEPPSVTGLLITAVHAGKAVEDAGLEQGDVILGVDGKAVTSLEELQAALRAVLNRPAFLLVARDDTFLVLAFPAL